MTANSQDTGQTPLAAQLHAQIAESGPLSFADYMQLCLYHPEHGYYMQPRQRIGKAGDFFTSSSVHALFGRLIARQLAQMAELLGEASFRVVEQGPGEGHLALDILDALAEQSPQLYERLEYTLVERSPERQLSQQQLLVKHRPRLSWCAEDDWTLPCGCLLSNELVDAFPVHLVEKRQGELQEVFVVNAPAGSGLIEELRSASPEVRRHFDWLGVSPAEGNRAEVNLAAPVWMRSVGERLGRGFVLTIDYGYPAEELYALHRRLGTLMCYRQHQADDNPYQLPGEKDITAHVDFTALQQAGKEAGLETLWFGEQYRFLLGLGFFEEMLRLEATARDEQQARAVRMTLKNLIMPDAGMGETFKVLVQGKDVGRPELLCARPVSAIPLP